jgi:hypothetical protein
MDVRKVARAALDTILHWEKGISPSTPEEAALGGFLLGVAEGRITLGQTWPVEILLDGPIEISTSEELKALADLFRSGICCQGQELGDSKQKAFRNRMM